MNISLKQAIWLLAGVLVLSIDPTKMNGLTVLGWIIVFFTLGRIFFPKTNFIKLFINAFSI